MACGNAGLVKGKKLKNKISSLIDRVLFKIILRHGWVLPKGTWKKIWGGYGLKKQEIKALTEHLENCGIIGTSRHFVFILGGFFENLNLPYKEIKKLLKEKNERKN